MLYLGLYTPALFAVIVIVTVTVTYHVAASYKVYRILVVLFIKNEKKLLLGDK